MLSILVLTSAMVTRRGPPGKESTPGTPGMAGMAGSPRSCTGGLSSGAT